MGSTRTGTPHAGAAGKTRSQENSPPGAPVQYEQENRSVQTLGKNPTNFSDQMSRDINILEEKQPNSFKVMSTNSPQIVLKQSTTSIVPRGTVEGEIVLPGEYKPEYCEQMTAFFEKAEMTKIVYETMTWKNGEVREVEKEVPLPPPQFSEFARTVGVTHRRLKSWAKKYPAFAEAYEECKDIFKEFIISNGLTGKYPGQFATFVAKNETDMKDKTVNENYNFNMTEYLNSLEKEEPFESIEN